MMWIVTNGVLLVVVMFLSAALLLESRVITRMREQLIMERHELLEQRQQYAGELTQLASECQFLVTEAGRLSEVCLRKWPPSRLPLPAIQKPGVYLPLTLHIDDTARLENERVMEPAAGSCP